ncbi:YbaN family protein [Chitinilyticum piscinae]|uniref:YbaN family protein n=1 Tax=Chitinilyticum piscinae TaxID=2866724 RepID=A0A8J7FG26_9NEIS|nr:YbaN family protein [Chitinilyticum piscinae]MBE9608410.1 YbaN family protein [Chitinilyticum piscinae]
MPLPAARQLSRPLRYALLALGHACFALGVIGAFLPVMPTTVFWIIAAWAFGHASPALQARLFALPGAGPHLQAWLLRGEISRKGKAWASFGMALGWLLCGLLTHWKLPVVTLVGLTLAGVVIWLWRKPEPAADSLRTDSCPEIQCPVFRDSSQDY